MQKLLVAMAPAKPNHFAGIHALNLAGRISAKVLFLLVLPTSSKQPQSSEIKSKEEAVKKEVELLVEAARLDGTAVEYYLAYGDYEREVIKFARENQVTLLVIEPPSGPGSTADATNTLLDKLRHSINCRIEVVNEKQNL